MREKLQNSRAYPPRLMDAERAAAYVGFGRTKFLELVAQGRMPKPLDVDSNPREDRFELGASVDDLKDQRRDPVKRSRKWRKSIIFKKMWRKGWDKQTAPSLSEPVQVMPCLS